MIFRQGCNEPLRTYVTFLSCLLPRDSPSFRISFSDFNGVIRILLHCKTFRSHAAGSLTPRPTPNHTDHTMVLIGCPVSCKPVEASAAPLNGHRSLNCVIRDRLNSLFMGTKLRQVVSGFPVTRASRMLLQHLRLVPVRLALPLVPSGCSRFSLSLNTIYHVFCIMSIVFFKNYTIFLFNISLTIIRLTFTDGCSIISLLIAVFQ